MIMLFIQSSAAQDELQMDIDTKEDESEGGEKEMDESKEECEVNEPDEGEVESEENTDKEHEKEDTLGREGATKSSEKKDEVFFI